MVAGSPLLGCHGPAPACGGARRRLGRWGVRDGDAALMGACLYVQLLKAGLMQRGSPPCGVGWVLPASAGKPRDVLEQAPGSRKSSLGDRPHLAGYEVPVAGISRVEREHHVANDQARPGSQHAHRLLQRELLVGVAKLVEAVV